MVRSTSGAITVVAGGTVVTTSLRYRLGRRTWPAWMRSARAAFTVRVGSPVCCAISAMLSRTSRPPYRQLVLTSKNKTCQDEPDSERVNGVTLKVAIYQGHEPVTNIEKITFDSTSENMDKRTKQVVLTLEDRQYDKKTKYALRLRDAESDIEQQSVDMIIDRAFSDDF
jgi:hypothetical protein